GVACHYMRRPDTSAGSLSGRLIGERAKTDSGSGRGSAHRRTGNESYRGRSASERGIFVFLFFQAEDGIRDGHVTGVQTCALPILARAAISSAETVRDKKNPAVRQALTQRVTRMRRIESLRMRTEFTLKTFEGARTPSKSVQPKSQPSKACFHASRFTSAMDSVSGMFLGQAFTQFCALAHSCTPPGPISASRRSRLFIAPVGWMLKRRTWLMMAAPTNWLCSFTCGQTSRQLPQVMQLESG